MLSHCCYWYSIVILLLLYITSLFLYINLVVLFSSFDSGFLCFILYGMWISISIVYWYSVWCIILKFLFPSILSKKKKGKIQIAHISFLFFVVSALSTVFIITVLLLSLICIHSFDTGTHWIDQQNRKRTQNSIFCVVYCLAPPIHQLNSNSTDE